MKTREDRGRDNSGTGRRSERGKVFGSIGCLQMETTMGTAVVVARVLSENPLRVKLVAKENVVGTASAYRPDHPLAECIRLRGARRRDEGPDAETPNARSKRASENGISVMDQEAGDLVAVGHGLDQPLSGPSRRRVLCDADMHQPPPTEGDYDEDVE